MAVLKCKMCGGDLNFGEGITVVECEYCGTKQTVPNVDNEKKIALFGRANRLRYACEFDKASSVYESIMADFPEEAEAYWGLVLCKYGIEYVDDPATGKKIPTCHRSSFESVMEDDNFEQALENADPLARSVYREEAKQIEGLRRGIIEVSGKEEPYDIFICYKETAENGERTIDSVIAQDVYQELTAKGYRVFFSRITLEDKLGQEYEPYIFAALNSAKIMLAFGTDYEYYNAVWVKNEWSRFLQLIAKGEKKTLIPCYKNIDAYDMPKEFAELQAQDMGKVGAIQDLLRGIEKLLPKNKTTPAKETVVVQQTAQAATLMPLLRASMYLEDGKWKDAEDYYNRVLDIDSENVDAHIGLLMVELKIQKEEELANQTERFDENEYFIKALRFSTGERRSVLEGYKKAVDDYFAEEQRIEKEKQEIQRQEEERRQEIVNQLEIKRQSFNMAGQISVASGCIFAIKWEGDSKVATMYDSRDYQWNGIDIVAIAGGYEYTVALKSDGTMVAAGNNKHGECNVSDWRDIIAITAGEFYTIGLKSDGKVVATGDNRYGQCDVSNWRWRDIVAIAGCWHTVGLQSDGTVIATGDNRYGQCNVSDWKDIIAIAAGAYHTVGLKSDGTMVVTGDNRYGQRNVSNRKDIVAIAVGHCHTVGLKSDGTVVAAGDNVDGRCNVSDWKDIVAIAVGHCHTVGLKSNGTVVAVGDNEHGKCNVSDWEDVIAIAADSSCTVGLKSDGTVLATNWEDYECTEYKQQEGKERKEKEQKEQHKLMQYRRSNNLCQHCGGKFRGLLIKGCSICGKLKDY